MSIPIPKRLKLRPKYRGLPIPFIALIDQNGDPDFRVTDEDKRALVIRNRWCQLCGEPLGKWFFFTGGTEAAKANHYFEPAAHLDCLVYAMQVCPFIVGRIEHANIEKVKKDWADEPDLTVKADDTFSTIRNPYWVIKKAYDWKLTQTKDGTVLIIPEAVKETEPLHPETMTQEDWETVIKTLTKVI